MDVLSSPYARLQALGIVLPSPPQPVANFVTHVREGSLLFLSGQGPIEADGTSHTGKVGETIGADDAYAHARVVGVNLLAVAQAALGDLDRVKRVVKIFGMVNAAQDFDQHPAVINGCSDLFVEVFGDRGIHARSAIGVGSLPGQITIEIEAIFSVRE